MDLSDISKDVERIGLPRRPRDRKPDLGVEQAKLKVAAIRVLAFVLVAVVAAFGLLVVFHYGSLIMLVIVIVYLGLGIFLAHKLFSLTYVGWFYTLLLSGAGVLMPALALFNKGFSNPNLVVGAIAVMILSICSAALLWWARDLFGIKRYGDIFLPHT